MTVVHLWPGANDDPDHAPCCGVRVSALPRSDALTYDPARVTCDGVERFGDKIDDGKEDHAHEAGNRSRGNRGDTDRQSPARSGLAFPIDDAAVAGPVRGPRGWFSRRARGVTFTIRSH